VLLLFIIKGVASSVLGVGGATLEVPGSVLKIKGKKCYVLDKNMLPGIRMCNMNNIEFRD
jgi:hypothetical protein